MIKRLLRLEIKLFYIQLTLKYGVNLLNTPVLSVLRQNAGAILTATGSLKMHFSIVLLRHMFYFLQVISYSVTKVPVLVVTEYKCASVTCFMWTSLYFYFVRQGQQSIVIILFYFVFCVVLNVHTLSNFKIRCDVTRSRFACFTARYYKMHV